MYYKGIILDPEDLLKYLFVSYSLLLLVVSHKISQIYDIQLGKKRIQHSIEHME